MPSSRAVSVKHADEYFKLGLKEYEAKKYDAAVSAFDRAITLGDRTLVTWDLKVASMSKADGPDQSRAYNAVQGLLGRFAKDAKVWKIHYRKADILRKMGLYSKAILALESTKPLLSRLSPQSKTEALGRITNLQSVLRVEASKTDERNRRQGKIHQAEQDRRNRLKELVVTNHFAKAFSPDVLMCICEHGLEANPNFGVIMRGVCREWRDGLGMYTAVFGRLTLTGKRPAAIPVNKRRMVGEKPEEKEQMWKRLSRGNITSLKIRGNDAAEEDRISTNLDGCFASIRQLEIEHVPFNGDIVLAWRRKFGNLRELVFRADPGSPYVNTASASLDLGLLDDSSETLRSITLANVTSWLNQHTIHPDPRTRVSDANARNGQEALPIPPALSKLKHLRSLHLTDSTFHCNTTSPRDTLFERLPSLRELTITGCTFSYRGGTQGGDDNARLAHTRRQPIELEHLTRYVQTGPVNQHMALGEPAVPVLLLDKYMHTPNLEELSLYRIGCPIFDALQTGGFELSRLISLDIGKNTISDLKEFLGLARDMTSLQFLNISHTSLGDDFLQAIQHRDGLDEPDQILPNLVAISMAHTTVATLAVRDFVNSRLPANQRMATSHRPAAVKAKISSAFRPSAKPKPSQRPRPPSQPSPLSQAAQTQGLKSLLDNVDESFFATQVPKPSIRKSIQWICLDGCESLSPDLMPLLKKHVKWVSWWLGTPVEDRQRGMGRWDWRGDWGSCVDLEGGCYMREVQKGKWAVQHTCHYKDAFTEEGEEDEGKEKGEKGWFRGTQGPVEPTQSSRSRFRFQNLRGEAKQTLWTARKDCPQLGSQWTSGDFALGD